MLATPEPTADAVWERFVAKSADVAAAAISAAESNKILPPVTAAATTVYVEDKFDGIRAHFHRNSDRAEIFSRDLRRITDQFPELADCGRAFDDDVILDGEIIAFEQGRKLTFFDLQKRLARIEIAGPFSSCRDFSRAIGRRDRKHFQGSSQSFERRLDDQGS